jgi:NAD(P)-dependent dehydrogenase (short-subunit alcohol dehydrogenase family)
MTDGGSVVNVGSLASELAWAGNTAYAASKAGVVALTRNAAVELAPRGIRVNVVCPSMIDTPMVAHDNPAVHGERAFVTAASPAGRVGSPADVAAAVHYLASDDAAYVTGQVLVVDGGLTAGPSQRLLDQLRGG